MILFWGQKVTKKCWDILKLLSNVVIVTMLLIGKLRNTDASLLFTGFHSFLTENLTMFLVPFANMGVKFKNLRLNSI